MNTAVILLGCNIGACKTTFIEICEKLISLDVELTQYSSYYKTAAWGKEDQSDFLNQVIIIKTKLSAEELLEKTGKLEAEFGRQRKEFNGPRTIDIDILFFNSEQVITNSLIIPHPRLHLRKFTLIPLNEIIPEFVHPTLGKTIQQLLAMCPDQLEVTKL